MKQTSPAVSKCAKTRQGLLKPYSGSSMPACRPTVRSGGYCYEDFVVNNPGGAILELSLQEPRSAKDGNKCRISVRRVLGDIYLDLYKRYG
jgi:hypothetical protein